MEGKSFFWVEVKKDWLILFLLLATFFIKLLFLFHGRWDKTYFVPYMTDETLYLGPLIAFITGGKVNLKTLISSYPPFFFYFLALINLLVFKVTFFFKDMNFSDISVALFYSCRILVLIFSLVGTYFYYKLFGRLLRNIFLKVLFFLFLSFNSLFFLYSLYCKSDEIVWALGSMGLYYGYRFWKTKGKKEYFWFFLFSVLPLAVNYYGYFYFLNFVLLTFLTFKDNYLGKWAKIFAIFLFAPLFWLALNFGVMFYFKGFLNGIATFSVNRSLIGNPFMEGVNNYSSFKYYWDYLRIFFVFPFLIYFLFFFYLFKNPAYYRVIGLIFLLFFIHVSLSVYRVDRLFLPLFQFAIFLFFFGLNYFFEIVKTKYARFLIIFLLLFFSGHFFKRTFFLMSCLKGEDTRQTLYKFLQEKLPKRSDIYFIHMTIGGASSVFEKLKIEKQKEFQLIFLPLDYKDPDSSINKTAKMKGYFVLSAVDYNILKVNRFSREYSKIFEGLSVLLERSSLVKEFSKVNYQSEIFGPIGYVPNSLYLMHNPTLWLYTTNDYQINQL